MPKGIVKNHGAVVVLGSGDALAYPLQQTQPKPSPMRHFWSVFPSPNSPTMLSSVLWGTGGAAQPWYLPSTSPSKALIKELDGQWVVWLKHGVEWIFLPSLQVLTPTGDSLTYLSSSRRALPCGAGSCSGASWLHLTWACSVLLPAGARVGDSGRGWVVCLWSKRHSPSVSA